MKLKLWDLRSDDDGDDVSYIRLQEAETKGHIILVVADKKGEMIESGAILHISERAGLIILNDAVARNIPLNKNEWGNVITVTEHELDRIQAHYGQHEMAKRMQQLFEKREQEESSCH